MKPCPGCGGTPGSYTVAARVFDPNAGTHTVADTCRGCWAKADVVAAKGRLAGQDWAGALARR